MKNILWKIPFFVEYKKIIQKKKFRNSSAYWEERYASKGTSGSGSYGRLALFKAEFLNRFVKEHRIQSVLEFGCGDGHQLTLFDFPHYIGFDVSPTSVRLCSEKFRNDPNKAFYLYDTLSFDDKFHLFSSELVLSLDVLYHLVEQDIYEKYLHDLFASALRYVIIYSTDYDQKEESVFRHELRRKFTPYVFSHFSGFELIHTEPNPYPTSLGEENSSDCCFYVFRKKTE